MSTNSPTSPPCGRPTAAPSTTVRITTQQKPISPTSATTPPATIAVAAKTKSASRLPTRPLTYPKAHRALDEIRARESQDARRAAEDSRAEQLARWYDDDRAAERAAAEAYDSRELGA